MGHITAGELNQRITLQTAGQGVPDGQGGQLPGAPGTELNLWARVRPLSGRELLTLGQVDTTNAYEVTLRKRPGVNAGQRLTWEGISTNVQRVVPDTTNREYLLLTCFTSGK